MFSCVEIVSASSYVAAYSLYFFDRSHGWRYVINKQQASSTSASVQLLKPMLYSLEYLGWGVRYVCCICDRDNIGKVEGAMLEEGEVERRHCAYFGIFLLSESRAEPCVKL